LIATLLRAEHRRRVPAFPHDPRSVRRPTGFGSAVVSEVHMLDKTRAADRIDRILIVDAMPW
jgi:hypothetical protein